jgi:short chain dehydrogenase
MAVVSDSCFLIRFSGKTAVVTGGSKGIGRAICDQLKVSGAQVWNWDVTAVQHEGVKFEKVDVTDGKQIDAVDYRWATDDPNSITAFLLFTAVGRATLNIMGDPSHDPRCLTGVDAIPIAGRLRRVKCHIAELHC